MDVIVVKPFMVRGQNENYFVDMFEHGEVISGFGFLKLKFKKTGDQIFHGEEILLGKELLSHAQYHTTYRDNEFMMERLNNPISKKDFLSHEDMYI